MTETQILSHYLHTPRQEMQSLDSQRLQAEAHCSNPATWQNLARAYTQHGRLAQAAACQRRATYYARQGAFKHAKA